MVELPVSIGYEQHRYKPRQEDRRHLQTDLADRGAEGGSEGVGRGHAGDAKHDAGQESDGIVLETLVLEVFM
jgi:hypothetical protein